MIEEFKKLKQDETELLLKAPALVSVMAVSSESEMSRNEQADAIRLAHLKTFTAHPLLMPYFDAVEKRFKENFEALVNNYSPFDDDKREALKNEIYILNSVIAKLEREYAILLHSSLTRYAEHVRKADRSLLEDFIFPLPLHGLTD